MIDWKAIAEAVAKESVQMVREYRITTRVQRGVIAALLILLVVAVIL